jgi:hypothetical protein
MGRKMGWKMGKMERENGVSLNLVIYFLLDEATCGGMMPWSVTQAHKMLRNNSPS